MSGDGTRNVRQLPKFFALLLLMSVQGCARTHSVTEWLLPPAETSPLFCNIYQPICPSRRDTEGTLTQIEDMNLLWTRHCGRIECKGFIPKGTDQ